MFSNSISGVALKRRNVHVSHDLRVLHKRKEKGEVTTIGNHLNGRLISISENVANWLHQHILATETT
jgi:hypothetical protein